MLFISISTECRVEPKYVTISNMINRDERGSVALFIALGISILLIVIIAIFGIWAFSSRQDYKDNSDQKAAAAVAAAVKKEDAKKDADFVEKEKNPFRTYTGPEQYGKVTIQYPKTWSAAINEGTSGTVIDGYLHPNFVPSLQSATNFALRVQVVQSTYDAVLKGFDSSVKTGRVKVTPYVAPKQSGVTGARLDGQLTTQKSGTMVLLPLRDKTIKIWTESDQFVGDFNNIILANLTFQP